MERSLQLGYMRRLAKYFYCETTPPRPMLMLFRTFWFYALLNYVKFRSLSPVGLQF